MFTQNNVGIIQISWSSIEKMKKTKITSKYNTVLHHSSASSLQTTAEKAMARCARRLWSSSTACSSWNQHGSRCPSSRVCCRPAWTCGLFAMRSTASWWSRPATRLPHTQPHTSATGSFWPAWAAPSYLGPPCSSTCDSTSKGKMHTKDTDVWQRWYSWRQCF